MSRKKVYLDRTGGEAVSVILRDAEVIPAGTTIYSMPVKAQNAEYDRWAEEYDIHFIFDDRKPETPFYAVPWMDIFAVDSRGGYIGTLGQLTDMAGDAPICYVDRDGHCWRIAENGPDFVQQAARWRSLLQEEQEVRLYASREQAEQELDFYERVLKMKHVFAVETEEQLARYSAFAGQIRPRLEAYIEFLQRRMEVRELPRMIVWTSMEIATEGISDIPVPAYTNEYRVVMTPETEIWRKLYLRQLDSLQQDDDSAGIYRKVYTYYQTKLGENHVMQILGHELAHHSEWFLEDFASDRSDGIWFEEGMAEYISRRYFLTEQEFAEEAEINQLLVDALRERYGRHSLEEFGQATYEGDYAGIFYEYWRSFLAIKRITERHGGDLKSVFTSYHQWNAKGGRQTLLEWFGENDA